MEPVLKVLGILFLVFLVFTFILPRTSNFSSAEFPVNMDPDAATRLYQETSDSIWKDMEAQSSAAQAAGDLKKSAEVSKAGHKALADLNNKYIEYTHSKSAV